MNKFVPFIFGLQIILALVDAAVARRFDDTWRDLGWNVQNYFYDFCTFFILYSYMLPMSLYINIYYY